MNLMALTMFGAQVTGRQLTFGFLLPWVTPANGQSVTVKVIHESDQSSSACRRSSRRLITASTRPTETTGLARST